MAGVPVRCKESILTTEPLHIAFVATEIDGLMKTGGLADVARALPEALTQQGQQVAIVCPCHPALGRYIQAPPLLTLSLSLGGETYSYQVHRIDPFGVPILAIDYPDFFSRAGLYDDGQHPYPDNALRFCFFSLAVLQTLQALGQDIDIIHCNDWHTAMVPVYLQQYLQHYPHLADAKTLLTLHNAAYQGDVPIAAVPDFVNLPSLVKNEAQSAPGRFALLRAGILCADEINAVSPTYAQELLTPLGSHGMYHLLQRRAGQLSGILNGCHYHDWDPAQDKYIVRTYDHEDLSGKALCKQALQQEFKLPLRPEAPLFVMISRLIEQKGYWLLLPVLRNWLEHNPHAQFVLMGSGQPDIARELRQLTREHPRQLAFFEGYDEPLTHRLQAGADFFLMPSLFEPCGLTQMYAMAYGTLPIVRRVGGLRDTITPLGEPAANGIAFEHPDSTALAHAMQQADTLFCEQPSHYKAIQQQAMGTRFAWSTSARRYLDLYVTLNEHCQQQAVS